MCSLNASIFDHDEDLAAAPTGSSASASRRCRRSLQDLQNLCSSGHFHLDAHLGTVREMLAALGEVHSAHNTALLLRRHGVAGAFRRSVRLGRDGQPAARGIPGAEAREVRPGPGTAHLHRLRQVRRRADEDLRSRLQRDHLQPAGGGDPRREAIIHKEYHLCSADPKVVGVDKAVAIGRTNYDVADQLSVLGMEAIHPGAAQSLRRAAIPLRVRHSFEPNHDGTLIEADYQSEEPRVEIIAGRRGVFAVEFFSHDMVDRAGHAFGIQKILDRYKLRTVTRESNANSITYYLATNFKIVKRIERDLEERFPNATVTVRRVAIVAAVGSNLDVSGLLSICVSALAEAGINVLAVHQSMRAVDIKFVVDEGDIQAATVALHRRAVETEAPGRSAARVA
jgi:aspartate kinase